MLEFVPHFYRMPGPWLYRTLYRTPALYRTLYHSHSGTENPEKPLVMRFSEYSNFTLCRESLVQIPSSAPKSSNVCSGIFCFIDLFGMTSIDLHSDGGSRFSAIDTATAPVLHWNRGCTILWQYRIILSADTASEVRQLLSQKRR